MAASPPTPRRRWSRPAPTRWSPAPRCSAPPDYAAAIAALRDDTARYRHRMSRRRPLAARCPRARWPACRSLRHGARAGRAGPAGARPLAGRRRRAAPACCKGELEVGGAHPRAEAGRLGRRRRLGHCCAPPRTASPGCATCARWAPTPPCCAPARWLPTGSATAAGRAAGAPARMWPARASPPGSGITTSSPRPADDGFRQKLMARLVSDARSLAAALPAEELDARALTALKGLIAAAVALPDHAAFLTRALRFLPQEIGRQVLPDGCHAERSPAAQLAALAGPDRDPRSAAGRPGAAAVGAAGRDRAHGAGAAGAAARRRLGLALFNGSKEEIAALIELVLAQAGRGGRPLSVAGRWRLPPAAGRAQRADRRLRRAAARPASTGCAHAGTLSMELSVGRDRLIVNCGACPCRRRGVARRDARHRRALHPGDRRHQQSAELKPDGLGRRPEVVEVQRQEANGAHWLEASHDGWKQAVRRGASAAPLHGRERRGRARRGRGGGGEPAALHGALPSAPRRQRQPAAGRRGGAAAAALRRRLAAARRRRPASRWRRASTSAAPSRGAASRWC